MSATGYLCAVLIVLLGCQSYRLHVANVEQKAFAERTESVFEDAQDCEETLDAMRLNRYQRGQT